MLPSILLLALLLRCMLFWLLVLVAGRPVPGCCGAARRIGVLPVRVRYLMCRRAAILVVSEKVGSAVS